MYVRKVNVKCEVNEKHRYIMYIFAVMIGWKIKCD